MHNPHCEAPMLKWQTVLRAGLVISCLLHPTIAPAQYVVENLGRGVIAIRASETTVYVGWRLLGTDPAGPRVQRLSRDRIGPAGEVECRRRSWRRRTWSTPPRT